MKTPASPLPFFNLDLPRLPPQEALARFDAATPPGWARHPIGLRERLGAAPHPALVPRYDVALVVGGHREPERQFGPVTIERVPSYGWAVAELTYWTVLLEQEQKLAQAECRRARTAPQDLFEVETRMRYEASGYNVEPPERLPSGQIAEFSIRTRNGDRIHVECKHVSESVPPDAVDSAVENQRRAELLLHNVSRVRRWNGYLRVDIDPGAAASLSDRDLVRDSGLAVMRMIPNLDTLGVPKECTERLGWGAVTIVIDEGLLVGGYAVQAAELSRHGVHPFDGYRSVFGYAEDPRPHDSIVLFALPFRLTVAVGPGLRLDELLKRQFEKARSKSRGATEHMVTHIRLSLPEALLDQPMPFGTTPTLRRDEALNTAMDRIAGTLSAGVADSMAICEVSTWATEGDRHTDGRLVPVSRVIVRPTSPQATELAGELRGAGLLA
jgi:hypothetical protein